MKLQKYSLLAHHTHTHMAGNQVYSYLNWCIT